MKILYLTSWYPTKKNPTVGIFIKEHAKAIHLAGNELVVIAILIETSKSLFNKKVLDYIDENGIRTIEIQLSSQFKDILYHLIPIQYFICKQTYNNLFSKNFSPDIIHSNVIFPAGIIGSWLANDLKKPHVITEHWSRINGLLRKPILSNWAKIAYKNASKIVPVSRFLQNRISNLIPEIEEIKFSVVGNIVDSSTFKYKKKTNLDNTIQFCAIATWANKKVADKLPELFIEALSKVQTNENRHLKLIMIGGGDKVEELKLLCEKNNLDTEFTGYLDKTQIAEHLQKSNFFVHASTVETFGVVTAEALLCGTPVICSNVGALPELVNDSNGVLCENILECWVNGLNRIIKYEFNTQEIAENVSNKFSTEEIGKQITSIYRELT